MRPPGAISVRPFRADDWWRSKASQLMGLVYLYSFYFHIPFARFTPLAVLSVIVIAGFASFGYLINDFYDKEKDRLAGKRNFLLGKSPLYQGLVIMASLLLVVLPWIYLPADKVSAILIAVQLLMFLLYSAPPIRLKEKGATGVVIDALYAHAVPATLAAYTFFLASPAVVPYMVFVLLFAWQFLCGVRNILIHQLEDRQADSSSGTATFITSISEHSAIGMIRYALIAEFVVYIALFAWLSVSSYWFAASVAIFLILSMGSVAIYRQLARGEMPAQPLRYFPNSVYEKWLPVLFLAFLSVADLQFLIFLVIHVCLFNFSLITEAALRTYHSLVFIKFRILFPIRNVLSRVFNYSVFYFFLLFGVDLRREQMSAIDYFKRRWRIYR